MTIVRIDRFTGMIAMVNRPLWILGIFLFFATGSRPEAQMQDKTIYELHHTSWTAKDGISEIINDIAQTRDGYLWLGTANGLYRFDGVRFERFEPRGVGLASNIIETLLASPDGGLFLGFRDAGASFLKDGTVSAHASDDDAPMGTVRSFAIDRNGTVWAAAFRGLYQLVGSKWHRVGMERGYPWPRAQAVLVDRDGTLWVAGDGTVVFLPPGQTRFQPTGNQISEVDDMVQAPNGEIWMAETTNSIRTVSAPSGTLLPNSRLDDAGAVRLLFDRGGSMWVTFAGDGVGRVRLPDALIGHETKTFTSVGERFSETDGLSSNDSSGLLEDREGNIWVGTSKGLDRLEKVNLNPVALRAGSEDMMLIPGDHGDLWTGSLNRPLTHIIGHSVTEINLGEWGCTSGYKDGDGTLWLAGPLGIGHVVAGKLRKLSLPEGLSNSWTVAIAKGYEGSLWAVFSRGGVYRYTGGVWALFGSSQGLPEDIPTNLYADSRSEIWFGYSRSRLGLYAGNRIRTFTQADGLAVGDVMTVYDSGKHLWIGGADGIQLLEDGHFRTIHIFDPKRLRGISGIVETIEGDLWLNAADGIIHILASEVQRSLYNPEYLATFDGFDYRDGLPGTSSELRVRPTAVETSDGKLWFTVAGGIVWLDPAHITRNLLPPPVYVESVEVNGAQYIRPTSLNLPPRTTNLEIRYTALSLTAPDRVSFRYKLDGVDHDWQNPGSRREAFYTSLGPGRHHFQVIASNNDGIWNKTGATLEFQIAPAFFQTTWFLIACILLGILVICILYQMRMRRIMATMSHSFDERLSERTRMARELHDTFLQTVQGSKMVADDALDPGSDEIRMRQALEKLSRFLAQAVDEGRAALHSLRISTTEKNHLSEALQRATEDHQIASSMTVAFSVVGDARDLHPIVRDEVYRIGYEAIRNAAVHSRGSQLDIDLRYTNDLFLRIKDNGLGIDPAVSNQGKAGHFGLQGMRERAARIHGKLSILSSANAGTEVTLVVPGKVIYRKTRPSWIERFKAAVQRLLGLSNLDS